MKRLGRHASWKKILREVSEWRNQSKNASKKLMMLRF